MGRVRHVFAEKDGATVRSGLTHVYGIEQRRVESHPTIMRPPNGWIANPPYML